MSEIKNDEKISKSKLCLKLSQEILYNSLAQAILKLYRTPHRILKLFWLTCVLVSLGFASYTVIQSILDYLSFDVVTKSRTIFERPTLFPKVTICMLSPFTTKYAYDFLKDNIDSPYNFLRNESLLDDLNFSHKYDFIYKFTKTALSMLDDKEGLVRFVDNCPWTSIVHGQLSMLHGHCPCHIYIVHFICPCNMDNIHEI